MKTDTIQPVDNPLCECHEEPMYWHKDKNSRQGGYWRCRAQKRKWQEVWRRKQGMKESNACHPLPFLKGETKPRCSNHGELMLLSRRTGQRTGEEYWKCSVKNREADQRYEASHVRISVGGLRFKYPINPEKREQIVEKLQEFRSQQKNEYKEKANGRIN